MAEFAAFRQTPAATASSPALTLSAFSAVGAVKPGAVPTAGSASSSSPSSSSSHAPVEAAVAAAIALPVQVEHHPASAIHSAAAM